MHHVEEAVIWGEQIMVCTYKRDNSGSGVIILEENLVQIGLVIAEILLFMKSYIDKKTLSKSAGVTLLLSAQYHQFGEICK